MYFETG
ncbi:uncharacterized protein CPUR_07352 [Claviceps purpurea 20.1]|nr:uncharacterized protein CPUR_07352 [Claviceps purpurea 20.1]